MLMMEEVVRVRIFEVLLKYVERIIRNIRILRLRVLYGILKIIDVRIFEIILL